MSSKNPLGIHEIRRGYVCRKGDIPSSTMRAVTMSNGHRYEVMRMWRYVYWVVGELVEHPVPVGYQYIDRGIAAHGTKHLDGKTEGDDRKPYDAIVGVYLTPVTGHDQGGLIVYPGSHQVVAEAVRDGFDIHNGVPPTGSIQPWVVRASVGDVLVMAPTLVHASDQNMHVNRKVVYYRVRSAGPDVGVGDGGVFSYPYKNWRV